MEEKRCQNCKYFFAYYIKSMRGYFHKMPTEGHCICMELSPALKKKNIAKCLACEYWQSIELQIEERKNIVCKYIEKIAEYLSDVSVILSDDCGRVNLPVYNGEDTFK